MAALLDALLDEQVDNGASLLSCVCICCGPPALLALTRCSKRLRQAVAAPLQQVERQSAAKVCEHIGATLEELAADDVVAWRFGLPLAQCRHLGVWLQPGGPLERVATLRLREENNGVIEVDLTPLRSGAKKCKRRSTCYNRGVNAEMMTVLARLFAFNAVLKTLWLNQNNIGDAGATAIADALKFNAVMETLILGANDIGDEGAKALASALEVNAVMTKLRCARFRSLLTKLP